jgi:hypothetical protein
MERNEFLSYNDTLCKFTLKGGKKVFGIIWENEYGNELIYFFSTAAERVRFKTAEKINDFRACERLITRVQLNDIVQAVPLR